MGSEMCIRDRQYWDDLKEEFGIEIDPPKQLPPPEPRQTRKQTKSLFWADLRNWGVEEVAAPPRPPSPPPLSWTEPQERQLRPRHTYQPDNTVGANDPNIYKCPTCYAPNFYRLDACNKLVCRNCHVPFCVKCGQGYAPGEAVHAQCRVV